MANDSDRELLCNLSGFALPLRKSSITTCFRFANSESHIPQNLACIQAPLRALRDLHCSRSPHRRLVVIHFRSSPHEYQLSVR